MNLYIQSFKTAFAVATDCPVVSEYEHDLFYHIEGYNALNLIEKAEYICLGGDLPLNISYYDVTKELHIFDPHGKPMLTKR